MRSVVAGARGMRQSGNHTGKLLTIAALFHLTMMVPSHGDTGEVPFACQLFTPDAEMVTQILEMQLEDVLHTLTMPEIYFEDRWDRVDGAVHSAQLLSVADDDFTPVARSDTASLIKDKNRDYITFVLGDYVAFNEFLGTTVNHLDQRVGRNLADYEFLDGPFGLSQVQPLLWRTSPPPYEARRDVYVAHDSDGALSTIIRCYRKVDPIKYPLCRQAFRAHGIDITASYIAENLADWKIIQSNITDFVGCAKNPENTNFRKN